MAMVRFGTCRATGSRSGSAGSRIRCIVLSCLYVKLSFCYVIYMEVVLLNCKVKDIDLGSNGGIVFLI